MIRRMSVADSAAGAWQIEGQEGELSPDVELFAGIGFHSRPLAGSDAEVVVVKIGGAAGHPVVIATRDESIRFDIDEDETVIYNSTGAQVKIEADGNILVRAASGGTVSVDDGSGAVLLSTKADTAAIVSAIGSAGVTPGDGGAAFKAALSAALSSVPAGTSVLKGK